MQQVSSPVFNQNERSQKKKSEGKRGNPRRKTRRTRQRPCQRPEVEVEEEEDLKQEENMLKEEEDHIYQINLKGGRGPIRSLHLHAVTPPKQPCCL